MTTLSTSQILAGVGVLTVLGVGLYVGGAFGYNDGGVEVSRTKCEDIASARRAVDAEFAERKSAGEGARTEALENAADDYYSEYRRLEDGWYACTSRALTADPCKEASDEITQLYHEIMADFEADKGFNEAKFNEREEAKKRYNECVEEARKPEYYEREKAKCDQAFAQGKEAAARVRTATEATIQSTYEKTLKTAEEAKAKKHAILDTIEAKCNEPGGTTALSVGSASTASTGTKVVPHSAACTGVFEGNDPDLRRRLAQMEAKLAHAKAAGYRDGVFGIDHLQTAVDALRQELKDSGRTCKMDSDCGDSTPVCCSTMQVGRAFCDAGVCQNEVTDCVDPEICAGKPAMCVAPSTGVKSEPVSINRTIPEAGTCSNNLQTLDLAQAGPESDRFEITGSIPSWLKFDTVGGKLPTQVQVTYSCGAVQGFGPGTYTAAALITVYNLANELINTIPVNIAITVTPVASSASSETGVIPGTSETQTAEVPEPPEPQNEEQVTVSPQTLRFSYDHANPVCPLFAGKVGIDGPTGTRWEVSSSLPVWLDLVGGDSGTLPTDVAFEFPCELEEYDDQTRTTDVVFTFTSPGGVETTQEVEVTGTFSNF